MVFGIIDIHSLLIQDSESRLTGCSLRLRSMNIFAKPRIWLLIPLTVRLKVIKNKIRNRNKSGREEIAFQSPFEIVQFRMSSLIIVSLLATLIGYETGI